MSIIAAVRSSGGAITLRSRVRERGVWLLSKAPPKSRAALERLVQESQGKGWGSASIDAEADALFALLDRDKLLHPVVFDVGANRGDWTQASLTRQPAARVVSFEPSSTAYAVLAKRFAADERVRTEHVALADFAGEAILWSDAPGSGLASLTKRSLDLMGSEFNVSEVVPVRTIDDWVTSSGIRPDALKLDVEGNELAVLAGAEQVLGSVTVVQFEFGGTQIDQRLYLADYYRFFTDRGFDLARLTPSGLTALKAYEEADEVFRPTNFYAVRRDRRS